MLHQHSASTLVARAILLSAAVLGVGCASVTTGTTQPVRIDLAAQAPAGTNCQLSNDYGDMRFRPGDTVQVRRSSKDLEMRCVVPNQPMASGRAISRANAGMAGNILLGGGIGAVIDHNRGTAYTYPSWMQLVPGQTLVFDRNDEKDGRPTPGKRPEAANATNATTQRSVDQR